MNSCIITHSRYGIVTFSPIKVWASDHEVNIHMTSAEAAELFNRMMYSIYDYQCSFIKFALLWSRANQFIAMLGAWPVQVEAEIDQGDYLTHYYVKLVYDKARKFGCDEIQSFNIIFEYVRDFAKNFGGIVDVSGDAAIVVRLQFNNKSALFSLSGRISCDSIESHIADPEWESRVARWLGVAT